jgi:hypothetical protein
VLRAIKYCIAVGISWPATILTRAAGYQYLSRVKLLEKLTRYAEGSGGTETLSATGTWSSIGFKRTFNLGSETSTVLLLSNLTSTTSCPAEAWGIRRHPKKASTDRQLAQRRKRRKQQRAVISLSMIAIATISNGAQDRGSAPSP